MIKKSYLTVEDVAKRFGVNVTTVYRLVQRGALPALKLGGQWRVSEEMLQNWVLTQVSGEQKRRLNHETQA